MKLHFSNAWKSLTIIATFILPNVEGHGYMYSPRSRNWVAHEDGTNTGEPGLPVAEFCPHCLNKKASDEVCGIGNNGVNYDDWVDSQGNPIPWNSQATYTEGDYITVKSYLSTNHAGHMDLFLCPNGAAPTQECFLSNPVEYIYSTHHAPRDSKYPWRGYYSNVADFEMTYKLPKGVYGDQVMMQWRYVTGNSCMSPGYCCHNDDDYFETYQNVSSWKRANTALCTYPLDPTGKTGTGLPEQFWNCAEITILPSGTRQPTISSSPTISQSPTSSPIVTSSPTKSPTPVSGPSNYCCSYNYKDCGDSEYCSKSAESCASCAGLWIDGSASNNCEALYSECFDASDSDVCCGPASCVDVNGDGSYMQCKPGGSNPTPAPWTEPIPPTPAPVSPPSPSPISPPSSSPPSNGCYSNNYKDCLPDGIGSSITSCTTVWLPNGAIDNCVALWGECTGNLSSCCGSSECFGDDTYASCVPPTTATSAPTESCHAKGEPCNSNADCCKFRCEKSTKTCKK